MFASSFFHLPGRRARQVALALANAGFLVLATAYAVQTKALGPGKAAALQGTALAIVALVLGTRIPVLHAALLIPLACLASGGLAGMA